MVRKLGGEKFRKMLEFAQPLSDFFFEQLSADLDLDSIDGRARLVQLAMPHLETLPEGVLQRTPIRTALALLMQNPSFAELAGDLSELHGMELRGLDLLLELVDFCHEHPNITAAQMMEMLRGHSAHSHLARLAAWRLPGDDETLSLEFQDILTGLQLRRVEERLSTMPRIVDQTPEQRDEFRDLQRRAQDLKRTLQGRDS
ncbi:MAG: hypothetical protein P8008_07985 [Gammaproteobacteria bacterium]